MKVLVTGGTGFLGRALCAELLAEGHELTILSRMPHVASALFSGQIRTLGALEAWPEEKTFDAVIHLAGETIAGGRWTPERKRRLWESRIDLTAALVRRMGEVLRPPAIFLSGSAVGCYGDADDRVLTETSPAGGDFLSNLCAAWEDAAKRAGDLGTRVCLLRTGVVLHPSGGALARMLPAFRKGVGTRLGDGRQFMSWIHREDYTALVLELLRRPEAEGPINLTAPEPVSNAVFTKSLARTLHRPAFLAAPAWTLRLLLGEMATVLLASQRALPEKAQKMGFRFAFPHLEAALEALLARPEARL